MWLKVTALRQAQGPSLRGAAAGIGRRGTVAAVALPDTRQRLRRGAEHLGGDWDGDGAIFVGESSALINKE